MREETPFQIEREASRREVLEHFLAVENKNPKYASLRGLHDLPDTNFFKVVRRFVDSLEETNPFFVFTVGVRNDDRFNLVRRWILVRCRIDAIYTRGINCCMKEDLASVSWNLKGFGKFASKYPEFRLDKVPEDELTSIVVGIECNDADHDGSVELVDGSHRVVSMAANGVEFVQAYIGQLK